MIPVQDTAATRLLVSIAARTTGCCLHFVSSFDPVPRSLGAQIRNVLGNFSSGYLKVRGTATGNSMPETRSLKASNDPFAMTC